MGYQICDHEHLYELQREAYENSRAHGFWDSPMHLQNPIDCIPEKLCLIHSEVSEALEAFREATGSLETYESDTGKPEGFASELADIAIRLLDLSEWLGLDLEKEIRRKMNYNKTRPFKHGSKRI